MLKVLLAALVAAASVCLAAPAVAGADTFSNPAAITINDSTTSDFACLQGGPGTASPYPSTINVSGETGLVTDVNVTLTGLTHTLPDDVDVLLVGPGGQTTLLMADTGGISGVDGVNLTFDDDATASLPDNAQIVSGTYKPTVGVGGPPQGCVVPASFPSPAPTGPYGTSLSVFNGTDSNGDWSLYVIDDAKVDVGLISGGWSLDITTEEPPDAAGDIADLRELLAGYDDIHHGIANALDSKLQAALAALENDDTAGACDSLQAFLNQVAAQDGKKLSEDQADALSAAATDIRMLLDC